ncbi:MAG: ABC transporter permease, partial [Candidatus Aminicenantes bacterium]|nr:ABC transporter permease [Candidatus Aminicenantes bacterium]
QLIRQFLVEALFFSLLSMTLAILLVILLIPAFNQLSGKSLEGADLFGWLTGGLVLLVALVTGIVSGIYPAFYLSSFRPVQVLKGQTVRGFRFSPLRRALVVFQFIASIVLLIGTTVVYTQLSFVQNKNLGYDKEQVLVLDNAYLLGDQAHAFKDKLLVNSEFVKGTVSGYLPVPSLRNFTSLFPEGDARSALAVQTWSVDEDYIDTLGMSLVDGRNFSKTFSTDGSAVIINRKAALDFGWDQPLGKKLTEIVDVQGDKMDYTVIGVVEDFHYESLRENIGPLVLFLKNSNTHIAFRILAGNAGKAVSKMEDQWRAFLPGQPFEYFFLDSRFGSLYRMERRFGEIIGIFALLSVFIGCLGLFGLASYSADRRTKEIGIRKVLGAGVPEIIRLLLKEFIVLVGLATLIAWPIAYVIMEGWLRDFSYRTSIGLWIFIGAGAAAFGVTFLTVGFQALKAAFADPIKSLRYE